MKKIITYILVFMFVADVFAQVTTIPDTAFEERLINLGIDSDCTINGQVLTSDIRNIRTLIIDDCFWITDVTGIEDFKNLERLIVRYTMITELDVSHNLKLKELDCTNNSLHALDVSANKFLKELHVGNYAANIEPMNYIADIDLSANKYIEFFSASNMLEFKRLNLKNGNNNRDMKIVMNYYPDSPISGYGAHVCIEVDNAALAQANEFPYSHWYIDHALISYSFSNNCLLGTNTFNRPTLVLYPNPATEILNINSTHNVLALDIYTLLGQKIKSIAVNSNDSTTDVSFLTPGNYMVNIRTEQGTSVQKLIIK